jgi:hypothetical protein
LNLLGLGAIYRHNASAQCRKPLGGGKANGAFATGDDGHVAL